MKQPHDMESKYGPNWQAVDQYLAEIPEAFTCAKLGEPHPNDAAARRIYDWDTLRTFVDYGFPDAGPHNSTYLQFLVTVDTADSDNRRLAQEHGLGQYVRHAQDDASILFCEKRKCSESFLDFVFLPEYDEPYPFCRYSVLDHCIYIAAALVVSHLTSGHLLQDMWLWYRAGHWPCGWEGNWPEGRLIVF